MSGGPDTPIPNGADAPRSLREIAEESWDQVVDEAGPDEGGEEPDSTGNKRAHDERGRFVSTKAIPGEQSQDPAREQVAPPDQAQRPAPPGSSSEAPQHWSAEDRATFARLPQEGRDFLLRRHGEMERDYQGKVQASASAVNFVQAVAPVFNDPVVARSLKDVGADPVHAINEWAAFHKRAMDPDPAVRLDLLKDLAQRMQVDPAAAFGPQQPAGNLPPEVQQNPAFRYLTDQISSAVNENKALRSQLENFVSQGERQRQDDVLRIARQSIDQFADETDAQGNRLRPHFDAVGDELALLLQANPHIDLKQAYEKACYMNDKVRQLMLNAGQRTQQQQAGLDRARNAARSNVRGMTTPVSRPKPDAGAATSLRAALEDAADEVGFEG